MKNPNDLISRLRRLDPAGLRAATGGASASTSTSGTPEAGDDTVGDTIARTSTFTVTFGGSLA